MEEDTVFEEDPVGLVTSEGDVRLSTRPGEFVIRHMHDQYLIKLHRKPLDIPPPFLCCTVTSTF